MGRFSDIIEVDTDSLRPHPQNEELFNPPAEREFEELKKSLKEVGLINPIVITEDNMIISGHWRVEALRAIGVKKVKARIFYPDSPAEITRVLVDSNLIRRTLDPESVYKAKTALNNLTSPEEVASKLIAEFRNLYAQAKLQHDFAIVLARFPEEKQKELFEAIKGEIEDVGNRLVKDARFRRLKEMLEEKEQEILKLTALKEKLKKEMLASKEIEKAAIEEKIKLEEKLKKYQQLPDRETCEKRIKELEKQLMDARLEMEKMEKKVKEAEGRRKVAEHLKEEAMKKMKQVVEEAQKNAQAKLNELAKKMARSYAMKRKKAFEKALKMAGENIDMKMVEAKSLVNVILKNLATVNQALEDLAETGIWPDGIESISEALEEASEKLDKLLNRRKKAHLRIIKNSREEKKDGAFSQREQEKA